MNRHLTLVAVLCLGCLYAISQENNPLINSAEKIENGIKLYDEGKYKESIKEYQQVKPGDTNYVWALYEIALSCATDSQFTYGIQICEEALSLNAERERCPDLLMQYGSLLDYNGQQERSLQIYDSAIAIYPNHSGLYISKGTTLIRMKKFKEAEKVFKQLLLINPYSSSAHFKLGLCAANQGNIVPAFLSLMGNIIMEPSGRFSSNAIQLLDNIAKGTDDVVEAVNKRTEETGENFRVVEQILLSKIALDKNYRSLVNLEDPISRQLQVIMEKLPFDENDNDFWMQFYVPFYKNIFDQKKFEYLVNYAFSGVNIPAIKEFNKKKKKDIDALVNEAREYFRLIRATRELQLAKRNYNGSYYFFENGQLVGKGVTRNNGELLTGPWEFYYASGNKKATGLYNEKGEKEGDWKYYHFNGQLKGEEIYRAGKQEGKETYYYDNGIVSSRATYKNGEADGEHTAWYKDGVIKEVEMYRGGKLNGLRKSYTTSGWLQSEAEFVNDKKSGPFKTYHFNGQPASEGSYVDDKLNGPYKAWYSDGVVSMEAQYQMDNTHGELKRYHENGKLQSLEKYNNGVPEGEYISWYNNGQIDTKYSIKKGKIDGEVQYYDKDGKLFGALVMENDKVRSARYLDKAGKQISFSETVRGKLDLQVYNPDGTKKAFTPYNAKGEIEGNQIYYYGSGKEKETNTYVHGMLNGQSNTYHINGQKNVTANYVEGKKDGYYISRFMHGKTEEEGWYKDDQMEGEWLTYNEFGQLVARTSFLNDELNGVKTSYWPNGKKESDNLYDMGVLVEMKEYDTTGKVNNVVKLQHGNGKYTSLQVNGKLYSDCKYVNGNIEGTLTHYFFDGSVHSLENLKKGLRDSTFKSFYYGGKPSIEGAYKMGKKTGPWKYYREDGTLSRTEDYKADKLHGKRIYYFKNGKIDTELQYENGERVGLYKKFSEDGILVYQIRYDEDVAVGYSYLGKNNEPVPEIPMVQGTAKINALYPNGNPSVTVDYIDGEQNGPYKLYFTNGKLCLENTEYYGNSNGVLKQYFSDGKLNLEYNYLHGNVHGPFKEYNDKGTLIQEGSYFNGEYHGDVRNYDDAGKLKQVRTYYYGHLLSVK